MRFQQLMSAVQQCHRRFSGQPGENEYRKVMTPGYINWGNVSYQDGDKVFDFLNIWGRCRLDRRLVQALVDGLTKIVPFLKPVQFLNLEDAQLDSLVQVGGECLTIFRIIHWSFDELMNVQGFGPVPASKTLHIIAPGIFVMWDNAICKYYGMRLRAYDYAFRFLPKMQAEAEEAIQDVMQGGCDRQAAIALVHQQGQQIWGFYKSIAKLIDEYNWITCHP